MRSSSPELHSKRCPPAPGELQCPMHHKLPTLVRWPSNRFVQPLGHRARCASVHLPQLPDLATPSSPHRLLLALAYLPNAMDLLPCTRWVDDGPRGSSTLPLDVGCSVATLSVETGNEINLRGIGW